jgi:hypothetical protein
MIMKKEWRKSDGGSSQHVTLHIAAEEGDLNAIQGLLAEPDHNVNEKIMMVRLHCILHASMVILILSKL